MTTNGSPEQPEQLQPQGSPPARGPFGIPIRWLVIGGGAGGVLLIVIVTLAVVLSGAIGGGNPQPRSAFDLVPDDVQLLRRSNIREILDDDLLADELYPDGVLGAEHLGIDDENMSQLVTARWETGAVDVIRGSFNLDNLRDELEDAGAEEDSYRGYEVWDDQKGGGIALFDGYIIAARSLESLESVLKNLYNGSGSLEQADDDNDMKRMLDKLDEGFQIHAEVGHLCAVERCQGYITALTEVDADAEQATVKFALLFRNERAAERAADDYDEVADFLERVQGIDIEDTEAENSFVVGRAVEDLGDDNGGSSTAGSHPEPTASDPASSQRARWIYDCDALDLSLDRERGINNLAELEFIVIGGERQCACAYDHLLSEYGPWRPPPLSEVYDQSSNVGLNVERYNSDTVLLRDASGTPGRTIPYYGHVEDLLDASKRCVGR